MQTSMWSYKFVIVINMSVGIHKINFVKTAKIIHNKIKYMLQ